MENPISNMITLFIKSITTKPSKKNNQILKPLKEVKSKSLLASMDGEYSKTGQYDTLASIIMTEQKQS